MKLVKGETVLSRSLKSKFGLVDKGTNLMFDGEGRMSLLLRSKS